MWPASLLCLIFALSSLLMTARAGIINGDFSNGLDGWTATGDLAQDPFGVIPYWDGGKAHLNAQFFSTPFNIVAGEQLIQIFDAPAGRRLEFDWQGSFGAANGTSTGLYVLLTGLGRINVQSLDNTPGVSFPDDKPYLSLVTNGHFSTVLPDSNGPLTLTVGVFGNWTQYVVHSNLFINASSASVAIDNVQLVPTPEPSSIVLMFMGMVGVLGAARRMQLRRSNT